MSILSSFLRSLLLTSLLSFVAPFILVGGLLLGLTLLSYIPHLAEATQWSGVQILYFLAKFGTGRPLEGLLVIGEVCGLVGAMFDTYAFYRYQNLRH